MGLLYGVTQDTVAGRDCMASGAPYKLAVILYVPCSGSYTSVENTMDSDEIP